MYQRYSSPPDEVALRTRQRPLARLLLLLAALAIPRHRDPKYGQAHVTLQAGPFCIKGQPTSATSSRSRSGSHEVGHSQLPSLHVAPRAAADGSTAAVATQASALLPAYKSRRQLCCSISGVLGILASTKVGSSGGTAWALARTAEEKEAARIFREATPAVVSVARKPKPGERRRRESAEDDGVPPAIGSGFLWDADHVVTNNHVVKDVDKDGLLVTFLVDTTSQNELPRRVVMQAQIVGADAVTDTAVLQLIPFNLTADGNNTLDVIYNQTVQQEVKTLKPIPRGQSAKLEVGQDVFAIGNPFGLEHSMSRGIISGISRTLEIGERPIRGCIQTDASINPGNSGGPLLDSQGRVIGVNTAILTSSGTSAGVGLAIPIDTVSKNVEAILRQGYVNRAYLGITFAPDEVAESLQIPGIIVMGVVAGSPAEKGGVKPMRKGSLGDVVTGLDGMRVKTGADLFRLLDKHSPGDAVKFQVQRAKRGVDDGVEELTIDVNLGAVKK